LETAEQIELKKVYYDGTLRELCMDDISNYRDSGSFMFFFVLLVSGTPSGFLATSQVTFRWLVAPLDPDG